MRSAIERRLKKLEAVGSREIPIWCDEFGDVSDIVDQMILAGELREADRAHCIHWSLARAALGTHARALAELSGSSD
jgi:hypothetical protein